MTFPPTKTFWIRSWATPCLFFTYAHSTLLIILNTHFPGCSTCSSLLTKICRPKFLRRPSHCFDNQLLELSIDPIGAGLCRFLLEPDYPNCSLMLNWIGPGLTLYRLAYIISSFKKHFHFSLNLFKKKVIFPFFERIYRIFESIPNSNHL